VREAVCSVRREGKLSFGYNANSSFREQWKGMELAYSCDKLVVTGQFAYGEYDRILKYMENLVHFGALGQGFPWGYRLIDCDCKERVSLMLYRNNFILKFGNSLELVEMQKDVVSFYFAIGFNSNSGLVDVWKLEFNPNKIIPAVGPWFREFLVMLKGASRVGGLTNSIEIKNFDVAIDFPVARDCVQYVRGNRKHVFYEVSKDEKTDYYGEGKKHGYTRIYNKGFEADLDRDLTRLEVTLSLDDYYSVRKYFEAFSVMTSRQMHVMDAPALSAADRVTLELLNMHPEYLERYPWYTRKKYKPYIQDILVPFELSEKAFNHVALWVAWFKNMDLESIFRDESKA
jgi:hypothetical protein